jgi:hypothetical protein
MAGSLGKRVCKEVLNHLLGKTPDTTPAGVVYLSLHTAHPGEDGQTSNEATGTSYARVSRAATDWNAATNADPSVATNATSAAFPASGTAGGDWSSGTAFTHVGIWAHPTLTTEANYIGAAALAGTPGPVLSGGTLTIAAGQLSISLA